MWRSRNYAGRSVALVGEAHRQVLARAARLVDHAGLEDSLAFITPGRLTAEVSEADGSVISSRTARRIFPDTRSTVDAMLDELARTFRSPASVPLDGQLNHRIMASVRDSLGEPATSELAGMERLWILAALAAGEGDTRARDAVQRVDERIAANVRSTFASSPVEDVRLWTVLVPLIHDSALISRLLGVPEKRRVTQTFLAATTLSGQHLRPGHLRHAPPPSTRPGRGVLGEPVSETEARLVAAAFRLLRRATLTDFFGFLTPTRLSDETITRWQVARVCADESTPAKFSLNALIRDVLLAMLASVKIDQQPIDAAEAGGSPRAWIDAQISDLTPGDAGEPWGPMLDRFRWLWIATAGTDVSWADVRRYLRDDGRSKYESAGVDDFPEAVHDLAAAVLDETSTLLEAWRLRIRYRPAGDPFAVMFLMGVMEGWMYEAAAEGRPQ